MELTPESMQEMITKALAAMPAFQTALHTSPDDVASTDELNESTKSFANFLVSVQRHDTKRLKGVYKTALAETGAGANGGYLVPTTYANEIMAIATEQAIIRPRAFVIPNVKGEYDMPALYNGGGASGTPASLAGVVATWTGEAATKTETEPSFDMIKLVPHELSGYSLASNRIMADNGPALESTLRRLFGEAIAWYEDYAFLRGTGTSQPLGIFNSPCLDSSNTIATDSAIVLADLAKMLGSFYMPHWAGACWILSQDVFPQMVQMVAASSGNLIWMPGGIRNDPLASDMLLFGKPVFFTEKINTIPDVQNEKGGALLCNLKDYVIADGVGGLAIDFSEHVKFLSNQGAWRFTVDVDGQPWLKNTITLANGNTVSPFVTTKGPA